MTLLRSPIRSPLRSPIYNPLAGKWGNADPLGAWLLNATYADYDARKLDRMFQNAAGSTAVAASGDKVGLWLDGHTFGDKTLTQVIAAAPISLNDDFSSYANDTALQAAWPSAPTFTATAVLASAKMRVTATANFGRRVTGFSTVVGRVYRVSGLITRISGTGNAYIAQTTGPTSHGDNVVGPNISSGSASFYFVATATTSYVACAIGTSGEVFDFDDILVKEIVSFAALNTTSTQRLNLLISGSRYSLTADGTDDNLLSSYLAGAGANSILIDTDVPASLAATQVIAGMSGSATARLSIGINTSGQLCAGVGSDANTTIVGTTDWRGTRLIAALSADGSTVKLLSATGEEYSAAQNGSPTTTIPARLAANNNNGTASSFYGGGIARAIIAQKALDLATFNAIRAQLLAS